jgi:hypothetical protein
MFHAPLLVVLIAAGLPTAAEGPDAPQRLRCEYAVNPLAVDVDAPRMSWEVQDTRNGAFQSAWAIQAVAPGSLKSSLQPTSISASPLSVMTGAFETNA